MENDKALIDRTAESVLKMLSDGDAMDILLDSTKKMMWTAVEYKELQMLYTCAIKEITTKLEVLDTEFKVRYRRNPISSVTSRLKSTESIMEKVMRRGYPMSLDSIERNVNDIAGVRVICSYLDDIYSIAASLLSQDDVTLISKKDYIKSPKDNGYRSLHLLVTIPVFLSESRRDVKVEIQIRTIAMDYWASLEHQIKYKKEIPDAKEVTLELKKIAETMAQSDIQMQRIREKIEAAEDVKDEDAELMERFMKLGMTF